MGYTDRQYEQTARDDAALESRFIDSDEFAIAVLIQGDDIGLTACAQCHLTADKWRRNPAYHPVSRPGAMYQAELYCADCVPQSYNGETGQGVHTYCGERHYQFTDSCPVA